MKGDEHPIVIINTSDFGVNRASEFGGILYHLIAI
jgi:hypothetical protein